MPSQLEDKVSAVLNTDPSVTVMSAAKQANWPNRAGDTFGQALAHVHTIIPHLTNGWPSRNKAQEFVTKYTTQNYGENAAGAVVPCASCSNNAITTCSCKWGVGPQFYVSCDGTIARLISLTNTDTRITYHAGYVNDVALGIEQGNLGDAATPAQAGNHWVRFSATPATEDIPGANLWLRDHRDTPREAIAAWWTTTTYAGPAREAINGTQMLFSEQGYRGIAVLTRFLCEQYGVPRSFLLRPFAARADNISSAAVFGQLVNADPAASVLAGAFTANHIQATDFANAAQLNAAYIGNNNIVMTHPAHGTPQPLRNEAWDALFRNFRGIHGHASSGDTHGFDHDCPGPLFDWHRFSREVWDWWWYPFDLQLAPPTTNKTTATPLRGYRVATGATPLIEYYYDADDHIAPLIPDGQHADRVQPGIHGASGSPTTFRLDDNSPVYALANGELIAARYSTSTGVSMSFALVRHTVFHRQSAGAAPRIDYDTAPDALYTLYMHLAYTGPTDLSFTAPSASNPDWLNRVLIRKRECDLGITFHDTHAGQATAIPDTVWDHARPGATNRPSLLAAWRADQTGYGDFLTALQAGRVATAPVGAGVTRMNVLLGDYLGKGGVIATSGGTTTHGVRVEVFAPTLLIPGFTTILGWTAPHASTPVAVQGPTEWLVTPTGDAATALQAAGVDLSLVPWWTTVQAAVALDTGLAANASLPLNGIVFHYAAFDVSSWINGVTWASEWPKYQAVDSHGNPVACPTQPPSRRI